MMPFPESIRIAYVSMNKMYKNHLIGILKTINQITIEHFQKETKIAFWLDFFCCALHFHC